MENIINLNYKYKKKYVFKDLKVVIIVNTN